MEYENEAAFQERVYCAAVDAGWLVYFTRDSRGSPRGYPDLTMVKDGRMVCAELKSRRGKRPSVAQSAWLVALGQVPGVDARIWYAYDAESADSVIETLGIDPEYWAFICAGNNAEGAPAPDIWFQRQDSRQTGRPVRMWYDGYGGNPRRGSPARGLVDAVASGKFS